VAERLRFFYRHYINIINTRNLNSNPSKNVGNLWLWFLVFYRYNMLPREIEFMEISVKIGLFLSPEILAILSSVYYVN